MKTTANTAVAVSVGDPRGIGPEVIVGALRSRPSGFRARIFGPRAAFAPAVERSGGAWPEAEWVDVDADGAGPWTEASAGALARASVEAATEAVFAGEADALCTAPISKAAVAAAGFAYPGHTEYLAARSGVRGAMMLAGPSLRVVPLTGHIPLRAVPDRLAVDGVAETLALVAVALRDDFGVDAPVIAVAGLNPHAGEGGLIGDEERTVLEPAMARARAMPGVEAELVGPLPADALFARGARGFSAVVCGYHDQALIPIKMAHPNDAVNVTLGLPIVRTSPAHGTAFDIAGRGVADPGSMRAALEMAIEIAGRRGSFSR